MNRLPFHLITVSLAICGRGAAENWSAREHEGRLEASDSSSVVFTWQIAPLPQPQGGAKFAGSAFFSSLRTPAGFECLNLQPADHLHHFGLWWPWKFVEVDGKPYNTWEIQKEEGGHAAQAVKALAGAKPGSLEWEFSNATRIRKPGAAPETVILETARVSLTGTGDARILDIALRQKAAKSPVRIVHYRYSGFSWRGPAGWNKENSQLTTSENLDRDHANGKPARWALVTGAAPAGSASVLILSAASQLAGSPERLRVWDSKAVNGAQFVNFNPVTEETLPLDDAHPAVSNRSYRVIVADRAINAAEAEAEWRRWIAR